MTPKEFLVWNSTTEPLSYKLVAAEWMVKHLQQLAEVIPQVGPARDKIELLIELLM